jgi:putative DNA methylase
MLKLEHIPKNSVEAYRISLAHLNRQGESAAGALLSRMSAKGEPVRSLAYRLYTLCERKGWADDARAYNELITSWSAIQDKVSGIDAGPRQLSLDLEDTE